MNQWERQKKEINSYNLFLAAITGSHGTKGFSDNGINLVDPFLEIRDPYEGVEAEPDFVLFNQETLLLVEVKAGRNINKRHIEQVNDYSKIGLEGAENFLADTDVENQSNLKRVESCIVYPEDIVEKCHGEWDNCSETLSKIANEVPVLTQKRGSELKFESNQKFEDEQLNEILKDGIDLPKVPRRDIFLSEGVEKESLAVSICQDIVLNNLIDRFEVNPIEIRNFYGKRSKLDLDRISRTLDYLNKIGACTYDPDDEIYRFTTHHEDKILSIESRVREEQVEEVLKDVDENQAELKDFDNS